MGVVVNEQNRLVGIFTERDVLQRFVAEQIFRQKLKLLMLCRLNLNHSANKVGRSYGCHDSRRHRHLLSWKMAI